jgi:predicted DsbA family dithiol-disulfide isomerase
LERPELEIVFDYVDPGSYLVFRQLERHLGRANPGGAGGAQGASRVRWRPLELRVPGAPHLDPAGREWADMVERLAVEASRIDVPFEPPEAVPYSRKAHELALHAGEQGHFDAVHRALFEARFVQARDLGRIDVLVEVSAGAGLDPSEVRTVLGVDRFDEEVRREREALLVGGVRGVPTLRRPDGEVLIEGYPGADAFETVLGKMLDDVTQPDEETWQDM